MNATQRRQHATELAAAHAVAERRTRRRRAILWTAGTLAAAGIIGAGLWTARPTRADLDTAAPDFTLTSSTGQTVHLSDYRGKPVVLYFSEGAGCDACLVQMDKIEEDPAFDAAGITVLPIVMNTAAEIGSDAQRLGVSTPFLLDDGTVSKAYKTLGTGMHPGLPGHGFVLVDADGVQRWHGEYPSMWIDPAELLTEIKGHLSS